MEPTTATVAFEIIAEVASAAKEIEEKRTFTRWRNEVSDKLDAILHNTEVIIADLKRLRVDFRDELLASFRTEYLGRLKGALLNLAAILAPLSNGGKLNDEMRKRIVRCVEDIRTLAYSSSTYGTGVAPTALAAVAVLLPTMKLAGFSTGEIFMTRSQLHQTVIVPLLDPARPGSLQSSYEA